MKTLFSKQPFAFFTLVLCALLFAGCGKDDDGPSNSVSGEIDGDAFSAGFVEAVREGDMIYIYAAEDDDDDSQYISITINLDEIEEDSYDIEDTFGDLSASYGDDDDNYYYATSGEIEFTTLTEDRVEATFDITFTDGSEEIEIEDGKINVSVREDD